MVAVVAQRSGGGAGLRERAVVVAQRAVAVPQLARGIVVAAVVRCLRPAVVHGRESQRNDGQREKEGGGGRGGVVAREVVGEREREAVKQRKCDRGDSRSGS